MITAYTGRASQLRECTCATGIRAGLSSAILSASRSFRPLWKQTLNAGSVSGLPKSEPPIAKRAFNKIRPAPARKARRRYCPPTDPPRIAAVLLLVPCHGRRSCGFQQLGIVIGDPFSLFIGQGLRRKYRRWPSCASSSNNEISNPFGTRGLPKRAVVREAGYSRWLDSVYEVNYPVSTCVFHNGFYAEWFSE